MSRTVAFGRDVLNAPDVDIEDLLACLSPTEVQTILDDLASDPDDKHVPPSVRNAYRCEKSPTGDLDRNSLISHINAEALSTPDKEEEVSFELGIKRGKVWEPNFTEEELAEMQKKADIAEKVKLEPEEEEALSAASLDEIMALADILNTNPQNFIMEAYSDPLKYFDPDPPNTIEPKEVLEQLADDDQNVKDVNLNNVVGGIKEQEVCDLFDTLRTNKNLAKISVVNCEINDFAVSTLCLALEENQSLQCLNLEGNRISPDTVACLFESLATGKNCVMEVRVAGQQQEKMGHRVETRIANAIERNPRLIKVSIQFDFREVINRVSQSLIRNVDKIRRRRRGEKVDEDMIKVQEPKKEEVENIDEKQTQDEKTNDIKLVDTNNKDDEIINSDDVSTNNDEHKKDIIDVDSEVNDQDNKEKEWTQARDLES